MIISLLKKGDREDPVNYRGITLLNVVGKLFKVLNYRLLQWLEYSMVRVNCQNLRLVSDLIICV